MRSVLAALCPCRTSGPTLGAGPGSGGQILPSNLRQQQQPPESANSWDEPDALGDVAFVSGVLGLLAGLLAVVRLSGTHFPDTLFWRALPLLLVVPPAFFLLVLVAPGGLLEGGSSARNRAAWLGLSGLASYVAPVIFMSMAAALGCLR
jgi:hypothetical protein